MKGEKKREEKEGSKMDVEAKRDQEEGKRENRGKNWLYTKHRRLRMAKKKVWWKTRNMFTLFLYIHTYRNFSQEHEVIFFANPS